MIANYAADPGLFERCINLLDSIFPGIKNTAINGIKHNAHWDKVSIPFIVENNGIIIAHLGIIPLDIMLNQQQRHVAAVHGICVKEEFRGKGLFKQLMREALHYIKHHFDSALLFTDQPTLYNPYDFTVLPEYDFRINLHSSGNKASDLRSLSLDNRDDLRLIQHLLSSRLPVSNQMGIINETTIFILDNLHKKIFFSKHLNALFLYEVIDSTLYIRDIVSPSEHELNDIIAEIPESFDGIVLQFCPDKFSQHLNTPALAKPECSIMVLGNFKFDGKFFRYPEPYRC